MIHLTIQASCSGKLEEQKLVLELVERTGAHPVKETSICSLNLEVLLTKQIRLHTEDAAFYFLESVYSNS